MSEKDETHHRNEIFIAGVVRIGPESIRCRPKPLFDRVMISNHYDLVPIKGYPKLYKQPDILSAIEPLSRPHIPYSKTYHSKQTESTRNPLLKSVKHSLIALNEGTYLIVIMYGDLESRNVDGFLGFFQGV